MLQPTHSEWISSLLNHHRCCVFSTKTDTFLYTKTFLPVSGMFFLKWCSHMHTTIRIIVFVILHKRMPLFRCYTHILFNFFVLLKHLLVFFLCVMPVPWCDISFDKSKNEMEENVCERETECEIVFGIHNDVIYGELMWQNLMRFPTRTHRNACGVVCFSLLLLVVMTEIIYLHISNVYTTYFNDDDKIGAIIWNGFFYEKYAKKTNTQMYLFPSVRNPTTLHRSASKADKNLKTFVALVVFSMENRKNTFNYGFFYISTSSVAVC